MIVLGLDPGSRRTGYGLVEEGGRELSYLDDGVILLGGELTRRLASLYDELTKIIARFTPQIIAVETPFVAKNAASALRLGQVQGVIALVAAQKGLSLYDYTPMEVKVALTGYGRASKDQVQGMVKRVLGLDHRLELDASDALAVAICHLHSVRMRDDLAAQR
ncbi:MAG: crossover junction endodeoxyribonuclease RuvC [Deltaproteobacteria bacterium]|nr:MAG: crossover junction endodeoxyribonuclease RuvC [Deltaproteobacteria bacterium]